MKSKMLKLTLVMMMLLALVALVACGGSDEDTTEEPAATSESTTTDTTETDVDASEVSGKVGIVLPTKDEPRWVQDETRFREAFETAGYEVEILFSQGDSAKERANVEDLITKGVEVLIITPHDGTAAAAAANAAKEAGVSVISYDRLIRDTDAVNYYVTFDSLAVGAQQAQYLVDNAEGTGNPLYLYAGAASDNNAFIFFQGAWNVLQPKIADGTFVIKNSSEAEALSGTLDLSRDEQSQIIGQITTNWDFNTAKNLAEANLTATTAEDKGNVFILAPNDGTARAIADTFATDGDVTNYYVTGQDAEIASVQYIIDGKQSMTVFKDVRTLVDDAISAAIALLEGNEPNATGSYNNGATDVPAIQSPVVTVDADNVQEVLITSGYYSADEFTGVVGAEDVAGKVGIVLPTKDEPRWVQDETRFREALEAAGYEVEILFSQGDSAKERANVEDLITKGVEVLIITPHDGTAAAAAANAAKEAGVSVISYDRLIRDTDAVNYYVTFDSLAVGAQQAQYLVDNAEGTGNPLYLYAGAASDNNAFIFFQGAWNVLQPKIADGTFVIKNSSEAESLSGTLELSRDQQAQIIGQVTTNWDFNTAKNLAEANLTATTAEDKGDVFILAPNDGTARAIADTFAADGDVTNYYVTGQDAEIASVQYIIDGKQSMTVFKDVSTLVSDAINAAVALLNGDAPNATGAYNNGAVDVPAIQSPVVTVDSANVKAVLIDSGYYSADEFTGLE